MLSSFAIFYRCIVIRGLLVGGGLSLIAPGMHAQARSNVIAQLQPVKQVDRVAVNPDYAPLTPLGGTLPGWVRVANEAAGQTVDLGQTLHVSVLLTRDPAAQGEFDRMVAEQQDPGSPYYHQWLTPEQVGQLYGPTADDLAAVRTWLTSQGLKIESVAPSGVIVRATGSLAVVGNAFHTSFGRFGWGDQQRLSAMSEPSIPAALSTVIRSVQGLIQTRYEPQSKFSVHVLPAASTQPQADLGSGVHAVLPNDFGVIYDVASVYSGGNKGATAGSKAQRIAIIGKSRIVASDITNYETLAGLPSIQPNVVLAGADPGVATGTNVGYASEATLDVDRVIGTAPGAQADLVISADGTTDDGVDIGIAYNIATLRDPIMTISFGSCEAQNGPAEADYLNSEFEVAASEGISTFVSSDDSGVAGCDTPFQQAPASQVASINVLCSSSYVTCVGGTEFNDVANASHYWASTNSNAGFESALSYIPEGAWNESTVSAVAAGGGGVSAYISKPGWQAGVGVPGDGFRDVPDVSFTAADHDGYLGCFAAKGGSCVAATPGGSIEITVFSGTSAAAPGMAGVAALLNTRMGAAQGNLNPMLYRLAASNPAVFHDVTLASSGVSGCTSAMPSMCNNSTPGASSLTDGLAGYLVGSGYDQATGLGSLDVAKLLTAAAGGSTGGTGSTGSFTLAANTSTLSVTPVANTSTTSTWTLTGKSVSGFVGTVALSCSVTPVTSEPPVCSISPASLSLTSGATAAATISVTSEGPYSSCLTSSATRPAGYGESAGGAALAGLVLLVLPVRKRRVVRGLSLVFLLAAGVGLMSGCGGATTAVACSNVVSAGTTAGTYTVTVTGVSGSLTETAPVTLTVTVN